MQTAVDEVGGCVHQTWPLDRVGNDQRDSVLSQDRDELIADKACMMDFNGVPQRLVSLDGKPGLRLWSGAVILGEDSGLHEYGA